METGHLDPKLIQGIIQSMYRLFRVGTFHALDNQAIDIAINTTLAALRSLDQFESAGIALIFAEDTCIVNGQLLRAPPDVYASAMDFSSFLTRVGVNSITIAKAVGERDLRRLLALFVEKENPARYLDSAGNLTPAIRLRHVNESLLLGLEDERLSLLERVLLTYALAALVLRRLYSAAEGGSFDVAGYFKRMARQLATVNYADRPVVFDVIMARPERVDTARLAINSAILAVAMARRMTDHESVLSRICMSALLLDIGKHRRAALETYPPPNEAVSSAILHMAMGLLRGDNVERTIITYEASALLGGVAPAVLYADRTPPSTDALLVATARRFIELLAGASPLRLPPLSVDDALAQLHAGAPSELAHFIVDLLVDAIGVMPRGTPVELNSGYRAVILAAGPCPSKYELPTVRLVLDERGERCPPREIDLARPSAEDARHIPVMRVLHRPEAHVRVAQREIAGPLLAWIERRKESETALRAWLVDEVFARDEAGSVTRVAHTTGGNAAASEGDARRRAMSGAPDAAPGEGVPALVRRITTRSAAAEEFTRRHGSGAHAAVSDWARSPSSSTGTARALAPERAAPPSQESDPAAPHPPRPAMRTPPVGGHPATTKTPPVEGGLASMKTPPAGLPPIDPQAFDGAPLSSASGIRRLPAHGGTGEHAAVARRSIREHLEAARHRTGQHALAEIAAHQQGPGASDDGGFGRDEAPTPVMTPAIPAEALSGGLPAAGVVKRTGSHRAVTTEGDG